MKQRLISAAGGLLVLALVFALFDTIVLNIAVAVIIVLALHELITAAGQGHSPISYVAMAFGATIPFFQTSIISRLLPTVCLLFSILLFVMMIAYHTKIKAEQIGFIFFFTMSIAFATSCFVYMRDVFGTTAGFYAVLVSLCGAWMSDTGAYFIGMKYGRRKLAPLVSPKKTVEGFWGGIVVSLLSQLVLAFLYSYICSMNGMSVSINYIALIISSPFIAVVSVIGDLSASVMKRQFGIKDFGNIMPGHGGVIDRFDSVLLAIPFVYNIFLYVPLITVK